MHVAKAIHRRADFACEIEAMKTQRERETRTYAAQHHDAVKNAQRWAQQERQQLAKAAQRFAHRHRHTTGANPALRGACAWCGLAVGRGGQE